MISPNKINLTSYLNVAVIYEICVIPKIFRIKLKGYSHDLRVMKLTYKIQVRIIKRKKLGLSSAYIAKQFNLSTRRVEQIWQYYEKTKSYMQLKTPGRKPYRQISPYIEQKVTSLREKYRWGATYLAKYLRKKEGIKVSNGFVHDILLKNNMATPNPKKQKRRSPWIRYERTHSLTLVHLDWHFDSTLNKWMCAVLDDASRKILTGGEYDNAYEQYNIDMLDRAYYEYLSLKPIEQAITDHGAQFYANKQNEDNTATTEFQNYCSKMGIKHILCKYKHPQTNGKFEKWNDTYNKNRHAFASFQEFIDWYNNRPHGSLDFMTPNYAFYYKLQDIILGGFLNWAEKI